jgi:hypothetical protein
MKTFYADILHASKSAPLSDQDQLIIAEMRQAEIINIQNVAEYFYEVSDQENWSVTEDFPNLAPPFPAFWMEYNFPEVSRSGERIIPMPIRGMRVGLLFLSKEAPENKHSVKWATVITLFIQWQNQIKRPCQWSMFMNAEGKVVSNEEGVPQFWAHFPPARRSETQEGLVQEAGANLTGLWPGLMAVTFLHCKNVSLDSHAPATREPGQRRNRHATNVRFHTLSIEPLKKILRSEGGAQETGGKHALHICRGHFKDFSKGKGLFGKYKDIFWWDSQVRGCADEGVVLKDYWINQPKPNNE